MSPSLRQRAFKLEAALPGEMKPASLCITAWVCFHLVTWHTHTHTSHPALQQLAEFLLSAVPGPAAAAATWPSVRKQLTFHSSWFILTLIDNKGMENVIYNSCQAGGAVGTFEASGSPLSQHEDCSKLKHTFYLKQKNLIINLNVWIKLNPFSEAKMFLKWS